ncbi:hypothetical protein SAMN02745121_08978 [Nannocystis exedens]|uniref:Uncharacterized protein n=1 Tax=Nannocystis exedens TaxID=54 RepID=A0A1I2IU16_9BACT|nr:hypothetical protein [Nannocystis exedens]PCC69323.1 hypothetical protein NAEX_02345 [Nannocystis exedens]SFF45759.1 hypothetical protein SAMN02745121_08978 [Nannocystis exedens]
MVANNTRTLARLGLGGVVLAESMAAWSRWERRRALFAAAAERARVERRRFVVVLPEHEGSLTKALRVYEMGRHYPEVFHMRRIPIVSPAELERGPVHRIASDSAVVYVACVLEYVSDVRAAMDEILRMAGAVENIYVVTVQPWTLTATLHPRARWAGIADTHTVSMGPITALHRGFAAGLVLSLAAVSATSERGPDDAQDDVDDGAIDAHVIVQVDKDFK